MHLTYIYRTLLFLRLVLELQQKLGSSVLTEPEHILQFVAHAIEPKQSERRPDRTTSGSGVESLRIVEEDSDDENEQATQDEDDMAVTAITLLLSILEGEHTHNDMRAKLMRMDPQPTRSYRLVHHPC